jgi:hypothetical protein
MSLQDALTTMHQNNESGSKEPQSSQTLDVGATVDDNWMLRNGLGSEHRVSYIVIDSLYQCVRAPFANFVELTSRRFFD